MEISWNFFSPESGNPDYLGNKRSDVKTLYYQLIVMFMCFRGQKTILLLVNRPTCYGRRLSVSTGRPDSARRGLTVPTHTVRVNSDNSLNSHFAQSS